MEHRTLKVLLLVLVWTYQCAADEEIERISATSASLSPVDGEPAETYYECAEQSLCVNFGILSFNFTQRLTFHNFQTSSGSRPLERVLTDTTLKSISIQLDRSESESLHLMDVELLLGDMDNGTVQTLNLLEDMNETSWEAVSTYEVDLTSQDDEITDAIKENNFFVRLRARKTSGNGTATVRPLSVEISYAPKSNASKTALIAGIVVGLVVVLGCLIGLLVLSCRKERKRSNEEIDLTTHDKDLPKSSSQYELYATKDNSVLIVERSGITKSSSQFYLEQTARTVMSVPEIKDVQVLEKLGSGNFGDVFRGLAFGGTTAVAVKKLKDEQQFNDVIEEAKLLTKVKHPNCVYFLGIHQSNGSNYIVTEFLPNGSLDRFLQDHRDELTVHHLTKMAIDGALGVHYLHTQNIIHRDLSARNLLVDADLKVKVGDFGMSKVLENEYYKASDMKLPVKWSSPEVLEFKRFTTASDSWSMGIVLYEIFTKGRAPYAGMSNNDVVQAVLEDNYRMPCPKEVPAEMYQLMLKCWDKNPSERPNFKEMLEILEKFMKQLEPEFTLDIATSQTEPPVDNAARRSTMEPTDNYQSLA